MRARLSAAVVAVCGLCACASYSSRTVPILAPTSYPNQAAVGDVVLVADLYDTREKYQSVFDTAPSYERGFLPINVIVFNNSASAVTVNPAYISCMATTGTPHAPVPAEDVAEEVLRSTVGRFVAGGIFAGGSSQGANNEIRADFANKRLEISQFVPAGSRGQGFVFCPIEQPLRALSLRVDGVADVAREVELSFPATTAYPQ